MVWGELNGEGSGGGRLWVVVLSPVCSGEVEESFLNKFRNI